MLMDFKLIKLTFPPYSEFQFLFSRPGASVLPALGPAVPPCGEESDRTDYDCG